MREEHKNSTSKVRSAVVTPPVEMTLTQEEVRVMNAYSRNIEKIGKNLMIYVLNFDEENIDWSPQTNYHRAHFEALDTPNLVSV